MDMGEWWLAMRQNFWNGHRDVIDSLVLLKCACVSESTALSIDFLFGSIKEEVTICKEAEVFRNIGE
uniref:Uncharacterized protein n=1 Tax=Oryza glumipatula TaxID=40148 RepID=A0A0E0BVS1_9ORYZ